MEEEEKKIVFENDRYEVVVEESPYKYQRFTRAGELIDSPLCYVIINKDTGVVEDEQLVLAMAITNANSFEENYNGMDAVTKARTNTQGKKLIQH